MRGEREGGWMDGWMVGMGLWLIELSDGLLGEERGQRVERRK